MRGLGQMGPRASGVGLGSRIDAGTNPTTGTKTDAQLRRPNTERTNQPTGPVLSAVSAMACEEMLWFYTV